MSSTSGGSPAPGRPWRALRAATGLSIHAYAGAVGVSPPTARAWEEGRALPQRRWVGRIAAVCGTSSGVVEGWRSSVVGARRDGRFVAGAGLAPCRPDIEGDELGPGLRAARGGRSLGALAELTGVDAAVLDAFEVGLVAPFAADLPPLAAAYGLPADRADRWLARRSAERAGAAAHPALVARLHVACRRRRLGPSELALGIGVGEVTVRRWLVGAGVPPVGKLAALADALSVPTRWLWAAHPERRPAPVERNLGWLLHDLRGGAGLDLATVAAAVGVDVTVARAWERGARPRPARLVVLASVLGVPPAVLVHAATPVVEPAEEHGAAGLLAAARHRARLSRSAVGAALGVPALTVARWERGALALPEPWLPRLASLVGLDPVDLVAAAVPGSGFGAQLTRARVLGELTVAELAAGVGVQPNAVRAWEREAAVPTGAHVERLVAALGLDASAFPLAVSGTALRRPTGAMGAAISAARRRRGLTQRQLARQLGVSWRTVGQWETGRTMPRRQHRDAIRSTFGPVPVVEEDPHARAVR